MQLAKRQRIIAPVGNAHWQVSSGEIAVHPYRKEIIDLVKSERVTFCTNSFIFNEDIARELHDNPMAGINISIDSGTAETWHKVKGVNNFPKVLENLVQYWKCSCRPGQITVKYIVLPGINDSDEDFISCINVLKSLDVTSFSLSRDVRVQHKLDTRAQSAAGEILDETCVYSASKFVALCKLVGLKPAVGGTYTSKERESINRLSDNIVRNIVIKNR